MWVDYALGGGSSGARTTDAGGITASDGWSAGVAAVAARVGAAEASDAGAHGTPRHPAGAHGNGQGGSSGAESSVCCLLDGIASGQSSSAAVLGAPALTTVGVASAAEPLPLPIPASGIVHA